jgi:DNA-binding beta-propeller fold protein YncE
MRSHYRAVLGALGVAGLFIALFSIGVWAQTYGPPYVIGVRRSGDNTTQLGNSASVDPVHGYAYVLTQNAVVVFSDTQVVKTLSVGSPAAIETAHATGYTYVTLTGGRMRVIRGDQLLPDAVDLGAEPEALVTHGVWGYAYVTLPDVGEVAVFSGTEQIDRVRTGREPVALSVDSDHNKLYVADEGDATLATVDLDVSGVVTPVVTQTLAVTPTNVIVNPVTEYVYVATMGADSDSLQDDTVLVIKNGVIQEEFDIRSPGQMAVNPHSGRVYVLSAPSPGGNFVNVEILSGETWLETETIQLDGPSLTNAVEVNLGSGYAYAAAGRGNNGVVAIISDTKLIEVFPMAQTPYDVAVTGVAESERGYVPIYNGQVVIFGRAETYGTGPISGGSGVTETLTCYGANNLPIDIEIPSEAIPASVGEVEVTCAALPENPVGEDFIWAGQAFRLSVLQEGAILPDFAFVSGHLPRLTVTYDDDMLSGGTESGVQLRYQTGSVDNPRWELGEGTGIELLKPDLDNDQLPARIQYPGSYVVVTELSAVFLPLVMR